MAQNKIISISETDKELYKDKIKIFIAEPTQGLINYVPHDNRKDFFLHIARLEAVTNFKFFSGTVGRLTANYAREIIAERCLEAGMDYILWIDDDMLIPFDLFERLYRHNVDMVMPLTFMRVPPYTPVMWNEIVDNTDPVNPGINFQPILEYEKDILLPAGEIGFGVVLQKVAILKNIPKPWFFNNTSIGEDIWFCFKAKQNGFKCFVDTSFAVGHLGVPPIICEEEYLEYKEKGHIRNRQRMDFTVHGNPVRKENAING
ncbi:MAG: hypothetical protein KGJ89_05035 [Patescibacteria group bacterium]|nr:hypothetical protein [Patescibacteria group bacterium]MDE2227286.1 hypothetical protein [Patescibacteria group bacterium]